MGADEQKTGQNVVKLGDLEVTLQAPGSYAIRAEITRAGWSNASRAYAAALGACWSSPRKERPSIKYAACEYSPLVYGQRVIDELVGRGFGYFEIQAAGGLAWALCSQDLLSGEEVASQEAGFQE